MSRGEDSGLCLTDRKEQVEDSKKEEKGVGSNSECKYMGWEDSGKEVTQWHR